MTPNQLQFLTATAAPPLSVEYDQYPVLLGAEFNAPDCRRRPVATLQVKTVSRPIVN